jgi:hypothetical protein
VWAGPRAASLPTPPEALQLRQYWVLGTGPQAHGGCCWVVLPKQAARGPTVVSSNVCNTCQSLFSLSSRDLCSSCCIECSLYASRLPAILLLFRSWTLHDSGHQHCDSGF